MRFNVSRKLTKKEQYEVRKAYDAVWNAGFTGSKPAIREV